MKYVETESLEGSNFLFFFGFGSGRGYDTPICGT